MTPVEFIRSQRPATAAELTAICGLSHEEVYLDLVKAEALGIVRVRAKFTGKSMADCHWEPGRAVPSSRVRQKVAA